MTVDFSSAVSAYKNAANVAKTLAGGDEVVSEAVSKGTGGSDFAGLVNQVVDSATKTIAKAEHVSQESLLNETTLTDVVTAINESEIALQTVVAVRDRIITAYQDIIKMPI